VLKKLNDSNCEAIKLKHDSTRRSLLKATAASFALAGIPGALEESGLAEILTKYNYAPRQRNSPLGTERGIYPGRVAWVELHEYENVQAFWVRGVKNGPVDPEG
jgi:hypothetical protein